MPDPVIKPLIPIAPKGGVLKKKKSLVKKKPEQDADKKPEDKKPKKGIIDTYA